MTGFTHIVEVFKTAYHICPNLNNLLGDVKLAPFWKSDGHTRYVWKYGRKVYLLPCSISINIRIFCSRNYDASNLKGLAWHELGHVLSWLICLSDYRFHINQYGLLEYTAFTEDIEDKDLPESIRNYLLDKFWQQESSRYGHAQVVALEQTLSPMQYNSSELLAESFKYAFAGDGHIREEQSKLVKSIVEDYIAEFVK